MATINEWCQYLSIVQEPKGKIAGINFGIGSTINELVDLFVLAISDKNNTIGNVVMMNSKKDSFRKIVEIIIEQ